MTAPPDDPPQTMHRSEWDEEQTLVMDILNIGRTQLALTGSMLPTVHVMTPNGVEVLVLGDGMPENRNERKRVLYALGRSYARDAEWALFVADSWVKAYDRLMPIPPSLEGQPGVSEALMARYLSRAGRRIEIKLPYTREPSDGRSAERIVFGMPLLASDTSVVHELDMVPETVLRGGGWRG